MTEDARNAVQRFLVDDYMREIKGLKGDIKAAEDAYERLEKKHDACPMEKTGHELFDIWDLMPSDLDLFLWHGEDGVNGFRLVEDIKRNPLDNKGWIVSLNGASSELVFPDDWHIIKQLPKPAPRITTAKEWLIVYTENGEPKTDGLMTYPKARDWLLCNADVPNFQPICVYKREENGGMAVMASDSFFDNPEYYDR